MRNFSESAVNMLASSHSRPPDTKRHPRQQCNAVCWLLSACIAALLVISIGRKWFLIVIVQGHSMSPIYADGNILLAVRRSRPHAWRPGDVLVFARTGHLEVTPEDPKYLVKRVIAVPGDSVTDLPTIPDTSNHGLMPEGHILLQGTGITQTAPFYYFVPVEAVVGKVICRLHQDS
ncbi:MAG: S26 family signal peptidase [Streptosporangiaceae bacterium]